mmetsp:Transcript_35102/g.42288  ORF Transcript_35102/g.42288 Transcript_35102/m.42288 type:complete len:112 (+) Transcript_35102:1-336(+)
MTNLGSVVKAKSPFVWADENDPICVPLGIGFDVTIVRQDTKGHVTASHLCVDETSTIDSKDNFVVNYGYVELDQACNSTALSKAIATGDKLSVTAGSLKNEEYIVEYQGPC